MFSNSASDRLKRNRIHLAKGKGGGKGNGKQKGSKGKGKGERVVTISNNNLRQERANDRRSQVKQMMLSTVLPKIADLSVEGSDTLFEVLSLGAKLSQADVKQYLGKPIQQIGRSWFSPTTKPGGRGTLSSGRSGLLTDQS